MRLLSLATFDGPSIWLPVRSVRMTVATDAVESETELDRRRTLHAHVLAAVPRLSESGIDDHDRQLASDLLQHRPLSASQLIARLAITLQREAAADVTHWTAGADGGSQQLSFACLDPVTGVLAGKLAFAIVATAPNAAAADSAAPPPPQPFEAALANFHTLAWPGRKTFSLPPVIAAAKRLGIPFRRDSPAGRDLLLGHGHRTQRGRSARTGQTSFTAVALARDKHRCALLLQSMGLPAPGGRLVASAEEAVAAARLFGYPLVLKPNDLDQGRGVEVGLKDEAAVRAAYGRVSSHSRAVLLESFIEGEDHRILVIGGRALAVVRRLPARVVGDGQSTIRQLVAEANRGSKRAMGFQRFSLPVLLDDKAIAVLAEQQLDAASVPAAGMTCFLRRNSNVSEGGTAEDLTEETHPDNLALAERAARIVGLDVCGVDFLTTDIGRSWRENGGAICEVNDNPGFGLHHMGRPAKADIGAAYLSLLFADSRAASIPIVAILESPEARVGRQLKAMLEAGGVRTGLATERELFVGEPHCRPIQGFGDGPGQMLWDREIGAAVFSLTARFIAERGLPFEQCDVSLALAQDAAAAGAEGTSDLEALALLRDCTGHRSLAGPPAADPQEARQAAAAVLKALQRCWPALPGPAGAGA